MLQPDRRFASLGFGYTQIKQRRRLAATVSCLFRDLLLIMVELDGLIAFAEFHPDQAQIAERIHFALPIADFALDQKRAQTEIEGAMRIVQIEICKSKIV